MKHLIKISTRFYIVAFLISTVYLEMHAFELQVIPEITSTNGYMDIISQDGSLHYDITNAEVVLQVEESEFSVSTGKITAFSANYTVTNMRGIQDIPGGPLNVERRTDNCYLINGNTIPLKTYSYRQNSDNEYEYLFEYTIWYAVDSVEQTPITGTSSVHFIVYDIPTIIAPETTDFEVVLDQNGTVDVTTFLPYPTGGYEPDGWHFVWTGTNFVNPDDKNEITSTFNAAGTYDISVDVFNAVPEAPEHWADTSFNYSVKVNEVPIADYQSSSVFHILKVDSCKLEISTEGGNLDNWKYSWYEGPIALGTDSVCVYNSYQDKEIGRHTVTVNITNTSDDNKTVWYDETFTFDIYIYEDTSVSQMPVKEINIFDGGAPAELSIIANGGASNGWTYEWSTEGIVQDEEHPEKATFSIHNTSNEKESHQVSVIVTNKVDNVELYSPKTFTFTINVYPKPEVQKNPDDDIVYIWINDTKQLEIETNGGNPNGWTYEWIGSDCTEHDFTYEAGASAITDNVKVHIKNKSVSDDDPQTWWYDEIKTFTVQVYYFRAWQSNNDSIINVIYGRDGHEGMPLAISCEGEGEWSFSWSGNDVSGNESTYYYVTEDHGNNPEIMKSDTVTVDISYTLGSKVFNDKKHFVVNTYPAVSAIGEIDGNKTWQKDAIIGENITLGIETTGGNPDGWTYKWNNKNETSDSEFIFPCEEEMYPVRIPVIILNRGSDGDLMFSEEHEFLINIWPQPIVSAHAEYNEATITECFAGDEITLVGSAQGGKGDWTCQWLNTEGSILNDHNMEAVFMVPSFTATSPVTYTISFQAINELTSVTRELNLKAYMRGSVEKKPLSQTDFLADDEIKLESDIINGYPNGWTYVWTRTWIDENGTSHTETLNGSNSKDLRTTAKTAHGYTVEQTYTLTATNSIGNNIGSIITLDYNVNVWPEIILPNELVVKNENHEMQGNQVREGNKYYVSVDNVATGGYLNIWHYQWSGDASGESAEIEGNSTMTTGNSMSTENKNYRVLVSQNGPNNVDWVDEIYTKEVMIYRRPITPIELIRKGNGQSHTLIVKDSGTGLDDESLFSDTYDYTYRFGYEENGVTHLSEPVNRRYYQMRQEDFNKSDGNIWAIAEWHYADGSNVTSGRISVSGTKDEEFDFSEYTNNAPRNYVRMYEESSGVEELSISDCIILNGYELSLTFDQPTDISINVYNVQGQQVQQILQPSVTSCSQQLNLTEMVSGVYFVEVVAGNKRDVKRVIVR